MVSYTFTPSETGRYTIYGEAESKLVSFYVEDVTFGKYWDELRDDTQYSGQTMELTAGTEYTIVFVNYCDETVTVVYTLAKTTDASGISINGDKTIRTNNVAWIGLTYDNFLAFNEDIVWTSSNPEVADIVDDYSLSGCAVKGLKDGTAVITATVGSLSASCTVTVKTPVELQLDQQAEITTEAGVYTFTAEESGLYYFSWPMTVGINFWIGGSGYPADMGDRSGHVIELDAGAACELECSTTEGTSNLVVTKVTEATGIDFPDGDTISCEPGWIVAFPITLTGGDVADLQITSGDNSIAEPETYNTSVINVYFKSPGETTFTITSSGGINETFTVKCQDRASAAEKVWSGTQEGGTTLHMEYTPDEDGCYFLNWNNLDGEGVHVGEDSTQPLKSFDYDELVYCGMVYELEAGKTYCFESYNDYDREYTFYLTKVEEAKSFTVIQPYPAR